MARFIHPPRNRSEAWRCALVNQLAFPGLGTIFAAQKIGYAQAALMLAGFFVWTGYMCWVIYHQIKVLFDMGASTQEVNDAKFAHGWVGVVGLGLCLVAWSWSLFSSIQIVKAAPENALPPSVPPKIS